MSATPFDLHAARDLITRERERFGAPGVAVTIVIDGKVVLCEGYGVMDLDRAEPVTADSLFVIASDTKAFTSATLCSLAADGLIDLDEPVRAYVPWFAMRDPHASALTTTRDLLAHRTGLAGHDLVWASGNDSVSLEDCARAMAHLEPTTPFRSRWHYCNLGYQTAGFITEVVTGGAWRDAVRDRVLDPLGMTATMFDAHIAAEKGLLAQGYRDEPGGFVRELAASDSRLGAAGGLVTSARDLSRWLLARLGRPVGGFSLAESVLREMHTPAMIEIPGTSFPERLPLGYGLGTRVEAYRGHRLIHHGGSLPGYISDVFVAPEDGVGIAILSSLSFHLLPEALALMLFDQLWGLEPIGWGETRHEQISMLIAGIRAADADRKSAARDRPPTRPLAEFAGDYVHPAYGRLTLDVEAGTLGVDFHGFGDQLRLEHLESDIWELVFEVGLRVPLVLRGDATGEIGDLTVAFQPGIEPVVFTREKKSA